MQVRRLMLLGMALATGLVVAHQAVIGVLERERARIDDVQFGIGRVSRDAASLLVLTQDYLLHHGTRARRQWRAVHEELTRTLGSLDADAAGLKDDVDTLRGVTDGLSPLFAGLESSTADNAAQVDMLSDHLVAETRRISDGAFDLVGRLIDLRRAQQHRLRMVTLAANLAFAALLLGLMAIVLRRVLKPMRRLQEAARRVATGDLQARSAYRAPDEFGSLSQSFDAMTQALQERQATLEATRRDLRTVLDAVPSMIGYWDRQLVNRVANQAYDTWFGVDPGTLPGRSLPELLGPALFEADRPFVEAALRGQAQTFERATPRTDGPGLRHSLAHYLPDRQGDEVIGFYVVMHDITELTHSRETLARTLAENEALLASIRAHSLYSAVDAEGRIVEINDSYCRLSGYSREELIGQHHRIFRSTLAQGDFEQVVWGTLHTGRAWRGEICSRAKDGSPYWLDTVIAPVKGLDGSTQRYVSIRTDVTERRQLALDLQHNNDRFEIAANAAGIGVWEYDVAAGTLVWDDRMYGLYGRSPSGGVQPYTLWSESIHPDDKRGSEQALQDAIAGVRDFDTKFRIVRPDGEVRTLKAMARVVRDAEGRALRMIGVNTDVTERLRTEAALQDNERLLRRVGGLANVGGWRVDIGAGKLYWSEQTRAIHEVPDDFQPSVEAAIDFYAPECRSTITEAVQHALDGGEGWDLELRLISYTGRSVWVRAMGEVEFEGGVAVRLVGAFQDITERRQTADLLRAATASAEAASAAKSVFLANMSHEIRTPLNAIIGVTHLLADTSLGEEQRRLLGQAQLAGRSLLAIVNDVLDLAKIEAGETAVDETAYEPALLLQELAVMYGTQASAKGLSLVADTAADVPRWLIGDRGRLQQMLTNLVANAIKFTSQGEVRVRLAAVDSGERRCRLVATVQDTGIGIAADVQSKLFSPFVQADASTTRRYGGTGLGLSIVKRLSEIMGGEVGLRSQPGQGSEFWFAVPQRLPSRDEAGALLCSQTTLEVLVIDDSSSDRLGMTALVRALGWQAQALESGQALVQEMMQRQAEGRPLPDVLLVDWHMPDMDGMQSMSALADQMGREHLPATLLVSSQERRAVANDDPAHFADHILTKPLSASVLFNAVNQSLAKRFGTTAKVLQSTRLDAPDAMWLAGVRVLLVDDSDINLDVASRLLERKGAQVLACGSADDALAQLAATPLAFDAVLMDVQMPGIDGLEATRRLRRDLGLSDLPVIALTAGALMQERQRALEAGMNEFLTKPLDPVQLVRTLRRLVEARRGTVLPVTPAALPPPSPATDWPEVDGIDGADVSSRLGGDAALFRIMIKRLVSEFGDFVDPPKFVEADTAAREALAARMHKLCGSAGSLGATEVHRLARQAETDLRASASAPVESLLPLSQAVARLCRASAPLLQEPSAWLADTRIGEPASNDKIKRLTQLLQRRDMAASEHVQALAPGLRARLGLEATARLLQSVDELDYALALSLLAPATAQMPATADATS